MTERLPRHLTTRTLGFRIQVFLYIFGIVMPIHNQQIRKNKNSLTALATLWTLKWFVGRMRSMMIGETASLRELFSADKTSKRSFARVYSQVCDKLNITKVREKVLIFEFYRRKMPGSLTLSFLETIFPHSGHVKDLAPTCALVC